MLYTRSLEGEAGIRDATTQRQQLLPCPLSNSATNTSPSSSCRVSLLHSLLAGRLYMHGKVQLHQENLPFHFALSRAIEKEREKVVRDRGQKKKESERVMYGEEYVDHPLRNQCSRWFFLFFFILILVSTCSHVPDVERRGRILGCQSILSTREEEKGISRSHDRSRMSVVIFRVQKVTKGYKTKRSRAVCIFQNVKGSHVENCPTAARLKKRYWRM